MKYDRTCSASGMFVSNNVMSFIEIWRENMNNNFLKQRVKSNNSIVTHVGPYTLCTLILESAVTSEGKKL